ELHDLGLRRYGWLPGRRGAGGATAAVARATDRYFELPNHDGCRFGGLRVMGAKDTRRFRAGFPRFAVRELLDGRRANGSEELRYEVLRQSIECVAKAFHQSRD